MYSVYNARLRENFRELFLFLYPLPRAKDMLSGNAKRIPVYLQIILLHEFVACTTFSKYF